jgi:hypothetical protein
MEMNLVKTIEITFLSSRAKALLDQCIHRNDLRSNESCCGAHVSHECNSQKLAQLVGVLLFRFEDVSACSSLFCDQLVMLIPQMVLVRAVGSRFVWQRVLHFSGKFWTRARESMIICRA